jgi:hypothetical protein
MGSEHARAPGTASFAVNVLSELPLSSLIVYRNGRLSERIDLLGERRLETSWDEKVGGDATGNIFVKVVRSDGEIAWSSPHWIDA